jgi:diacylglycerol kinase (ATP)
MSYKKKDSRFSIGSRLLSFKYALAGIRSFFQSEHNAIIHLVATLVVITLALIYKVDKYEAITLLFAIAFVWVAELLNTAIERLADFVSPNHHPNIKFIKDVAAAAVLIAALTAIAAGSFIFIPKIF